MYEQAMELLQQSKPALAELCRKINDAVECIVQEALNTAKNGEAFVSDGVLTRFSIDPMRDLLVTDAIVELLGEHPLGFSFDAEIHGYHIEFPQPPVDLSSAPAGTFAYGGWHFTPYRQFDREDGDFFKLSRNLTSNFRMGFCTYEARKKFDYTPNGFYKASTDKECDIFRCLEDGLLYVPCENELFIYTEPIQRSHAGYHQVIEQSPAASHADEDEDGLEP